MFSYVISCPIHMISHTFGWGLAVNVLFHLLTCSIICSKSLLYMFLHLANIFRATLCLVFFTWLHITSFVLRFTCFLDMIVHRASILPACYPLHVFCTCMYILLTYFMLCCTCFFIDCTSRSRRSCYAVHVFWCTWFYITLKNLAEIWNYVSQCQWRYNHRHTLWQMVPKVLRELEAWNAAATNEKGSKNTEFAFWWR